MHALAGARPSASGGAPCPILRRLPLQVLDFFDGGAQFLTRLCGRVLRAALRAAPRDQQVARKSNRLSESRENHGGPIAGVGFCA